MEPTSDHDLFSLAIQIETVIVAIWALLGAGVAGVGALFVALQPLKKSSRLVLIVAYIVFASVNLLGLLNQRSQHNQLIAMVQCDDKQWTNPGACRSLKANSVRQYPWSENLEYIGAHLAIDCGVIFALMVAGRPRGELSAKL